VRVLIVDDNRRLAELVEQGIATRGFRCDTAGDLADADLALGSLHYDAVILDLALPDGDGLAWLRSRRARPDFPPVLILTARLSLEDRVAGLDAGADDYLVKPVDSAEIAARLRALLRRPGRRSQPVLVVGGLVYDVAARSLHHDSTQVPLTHKEAELLELLMRRAGTVVRKSVITDALYRLDEEVTPNAIEALVSRLRHKIGTPGGLSPLNTVRGMGYILRDGAE
jgi:two-component system, OmpR family, response regulator QseB